MRNGHAPRMIAMLGVLLTLSGCNKTGTSSAATSSTTSSAAATNSTAQNNAANSNVSQAAAALAPAPVVIPEGKTLAVTIDQNISTKDNRSGDRFEASLAEPATIDGNEVLRRGTHVRGAVTESDAVQGKTRGKRTGISTGGGAAFGAIVGAIAGGGKGAAIGAAAGGGAGATGAAYTGDRDVSIPAERLVHFRLTRSVTLSEFGHPLRIMLRLS